MDEIIDSIKSNIQTDQINTIYLNVPEEGERYIWNELRQHPFGTQAYRLSIVRGAEKILSSEQFQQYIKDRGTLPRNYVIFVSSEEFLRKEDGRTWEPLELLKTRGSMIECRPFTSATAKHAVTWVRTKADIRGRVAEHLLNRATGDLRLVRDTLNKLKSFPGEVTLKVIDEMFEARPDDDFISALFALDRKTASAALKEIPASEYGRTLGLVDARLDIAGMIHDLQIQKKTPGEIAKMAGKKGFLVPELLPVAKHYNKKRRLKIRKYLAMVDGYAEFGYPEGALEGLTAIW